MNNGAAAPNRNNANGEAVRPSTATTPGSTADPNSRSTHPVTTGAIWRLDRHGHRRVAPSFSANEKATTTAPPSRPSTAAVDHVMSLMVPPTHKPATPRKPQLAGRSMVADGRLRPLVGLVRDWTATPQAFEALAARAFRGKAVLTR